MGSESNRSDKWLLGFYLAKRAEGCSPSTIADYDCTFKHLHRWCDANGKRDLAALSTADLTAFLASLRSVTYRAKLLSPKTIRNAWVGLRSFYRWLALETKKPNPMLAIPAPKAAEPVIEPLTREQVEALLKACDTTRAAATERRQTFSMRRDVAVRDRAIVLVLLDSGLRATELCALTYADTDLETGRLLVRSGKGGKPRFVYLGRVARRALWRHIRERGDQRPDEPLFVTREGRPFDNQYLAKLFQRLGERAGVPKVHPHRLRHTFASAFLRNGGNLLGLQRLLGHSTLEMVRRYAAIADSDLAKAHETGSPADRWRL